jgi:hypothetical protein
MAKRSLGDHDIFNLYHSVNGNFFGNLRVPILRRNKHKNEAEEFCCRDDRLRNPLAAAACSRTLLAERKSLYPPNRKFSVAENAYTVADHVLSN